MKLVSLSAELTKTIKSFKCKYFSSEKEKLTDEEAEKISTYILNNFFNELLINKFNKTIFSLDACVIGFVLHNMRLNNLEKDKFNKKYE
jgi:hypothetical protein